MSGKVVEEIFEHCSVLIIPRSVWQILLFDSILSATNKTEPVIELGIELKLEEDEDEDEDEDDEELIFKTKAYVNVFN